jgi:hypothetical protein
VEDLGVDSHLVFGRDSEDPPVKCGVMHLAQRQSVGHDWATTSSVFLDVRRIEEVAVPEGADGA